MRWKFYLRPASRRGLHITRDQLKAHELVKAPRKAVMYNKCRICRRRRTTTTTTTRVIARDQLEENWGLAQTVESKSLVASCRSCKLLEPLLLKPPLRLPSGWKTLTHKHTNTHTHTHTYLWKQTDWSRSSASLAWLMLQCGASRVKSSWPPPTSSSSWSGCFQLFCSLETQKTHSSHHKEEEEAEEEEEEEEQNQSFFLFMKLWAAAAGGTHWCLENQTKQKCIPTFEVTI